MKKRLLSLVLCLVMVFSLVPFSALAEGETPQAADPNAVAEEKNNLSPGEQTTDSMVTNKYLTETGEGYDLTMSAYATGGTMTQELESDVPLDIVLVLDQSGSMLAADMASSSGYVSAGNKAWTVSQAVGYYAEVDGEYYELKAERGNIYTGKVHPYLTDDLLGTSGGEDWHTGWVSRETGYYVIDESSGSPQLTKLYSRSYGYVGGYDCQFYYYDASGNVHYIPFNSANGSTTASYSRSGWSLGTGTMNSNSNRLWTTAYWLSSAESYNQLYYTKDGGVDVLFGPEVTYDNQTVYTGDLYYLSSNTQTRLEALREAAGNFVDTITERAKTTGADHRVAVVGFAGNKLSSYSSDPAHIIANSNKFNYVNTGFFSGGQFYNFRKLDPANMEVYADINQVQSHNLNYYVKAYNSCPGLYENGDLIPLRYNGSNWTALYVRANDDNASGWWTLNTNQSNNGWYYYFGNGSAHSGVGYANGKVHVQSLQADDGKVYEEAYTNPSDSAYANALEHVNTGDGNNNGINDNLDFALNTVDAYGGTYTSYGIAMANQIFANNTETTDANGTERKRVIVVFTDGQPGASGYDDAVAGEALLDAATAKRTYGASIYTIGLYPDGSADKTTQTENFMRQLSSMYYSSKQEVYASEMTNRNAKYYFYDSNEHKMFAAQVKSSNNSLRWYYFTDTGLLTYHTGTVYNANGQSINKNYAVVGGEYYRNSARTQPVDYGYVWYDTDGYPIAPKRSADDARQYHAQFYKLSDTSPEKSGNYYFTASNSMELNNVFQTISESVQTPYTTVQLDGSNSVLRDVITSHFTVNTNTTQNPVTFSLEKGTVASEGAAPVFVPVTNPTSAEQAIRNGITYSWVTNDDGSKTLDVKGFDYSANYVAYGHPGYKLIATVHSLTTDELGKLYSNESSSGVYKDDSMVAPLPMPYITKEADGSATYVMDFNAKMNIATGGKFQVPVAEMKGNNGTFFNSDTTGANGTISYQLKSGETLADGANLTMSGADTAIIYGKFYDTSRTEGTKTAADSAAWKNVTVVPASSVYFDDSFDTANTVLTVGDGSGYNANVPATTSTSGIGANGEGGNIEIRFTGSRIDVYCTTTSDGKSVTANVKSVNADGTVGAIVNDVNGKVCNIVMKNQSVDQAARLNVPTVSFDMGTVGTYVLTLKDYYSGAYKLDGVRVYNPVGDDQTATSQYADDEQNPKFLKLRDMVVNNLQALLEQEGHAEDTVAFFTDKSDGTGVKLADYIKDGPKNEIYLDPGEAIGFELVGYQNYGENAKVMLGLSVQGTAEGSVSVNGTALPEQISHTTDMYYRVYPTVDKTVNPDNVNGMLVIRNNSTNKARIAITNLKVSGVPANTDVSVSYGASALSVDETAEFEPQIVVTQSLMSFAQNPVSAQPAQPDQPEQPSDPEPTPGIADMIRQLISSFVSALFGSIARLFGH